MKKKVEEIIENFKGRMAMVQLLKQKRPNMHITKDRIVNLVILLNTTGDVSEFLEMI